MVGKELCVAVSYEAVQERHRFPGILLGLYLIVFMSVQIVMK